METSDRNKRVLEILARKDENAVEQATIKNRLLDLDTEVDLLDNELHELIGTSAPVNGDRKQMKCSVCGEFGHNSKRHQKEA